MDKAIERELLNLERRYWQSIKDKDMAALSQLTDYPCIVTGPQGVGSVDEATFSSMLNSSPRTLHEFTLGDDAQVRQISDDVAVVAYKMRERLTVEGEPLTIEGADASVWVRRDGQWRCAVHSEALAGDPYGRDRQPAH
jgi:hypothetical protein